MQDDSHPEVCAWAQAEAARLKVRDARLNQRFATILEQAGADANGSCPREGRSWADTQGLYRFMANDKISPQTVIKAHGEAALERAAGRPCVLLVQDTTEFDFTGRELAGAGPLSWENRTGFFCHTSLLVTPQRVPLGVVDACFYTNRKKRRKGKRSKRRPFAQKQAVRWRNGYELAGRVKGQLDQTEVISIADRECDIYECFEAAQQARDGGQPYAELLVRAAQDRRVLHPDDPNRPDKLLAYLKDAPLVATTTFTMLARGDQPEREVTQEIHACRVTLRPPARVGVKLPEVTINAVLAIEAQPPPGCKPVVWLLLTTLPIDTPEEVMRIHQLYLARWEIEVFFRILKTGCQVEARQFRSAKTMLPCLSVFMIVAWRIRYLQQMCQVNPAAPCTVCCSSEEWQVLHQVVKGPPPAEPPTLQEFIMLLGRAGGHLGRRRDGQPGPKHIWQGLAALQHYLDAWHAFTNRARICV